MNSDLNKGFASKKRFQAPELIEFGDIVNLTAVGKTNPGTDMHLGSVNPPGHGKGKGVIGGGPFD